MFRVKTINQTLTQLEKMAKKLISGLILARFWPNLVPKDFFVGFISTRCYTLLEAITVCNFKEN